MIALQTHVRSGPRIDNNSYEILNGKQTMYIRLNILGF
jgi:uncharacterized protein HemX